MSRKLDYLPKTCEYFVMAKGAKPPVGALQLEIAAILRAHIARLQVTQGSIAEAANLSPTQMSDIVGGRKHVDIEQLDRICFALGLKLRDVVIEAETATASRHAEQSAKATRAR